MNQKTLNIVLSLTVLSLFLFIILRSDTTEPDYSKYYQEREQILNKLNTLETSYNRLETTITKEHEKIDSANTHSLHAITADLLTD